MVKIRADNWSKKIVAADDVVKQLKKMLELEIGIYASNWTKFKRRFAFDFAYLDERAELYPLATKGDLSTQDVKQLEKIFIEFRKNAKTV